MTSEETSRGEWIAVEETPDPSQASRVEAFLRELGMPVKVSARSSVTGEIEVQVPLDQLSRALAELDELDTADDEERRD